MQANEQEVQTEQAEAEGIYKSKWQCPTLICRGIFPLIHYKYTGVVTQEQAHSGGEQGQWTAQQ